MDQNVIVQSCVSYHNDPVYLKIERIFVQDLASIDESQNGNEERHVKTIATRLKPVVWLASGDNDI